MRRCSICEAKKIVDDCWVTFTFGPDDKIYYQEWSKGMGVYRCDLDGSNVEKLELFENAIYDDGVNKKEYDKMGFDIVAAPSLRYVYYIHKNGNYFLVLDTEDIQYVRLKTY